MLIKDLFATKILDSRKEPTIEVSVNGCKASSPSGKSKGKYETPSYKKSLAQDIKTINKLKLDFDINNFSDLIKVERICKNKLGANSLFALESAVLKALAKSQGKQLWEILNSRAKRLPTPLGNAIGGGLHSSNKNPPTFQEFLLAPNKKSIRENVKIMNQTYSKLKKILKSKSKNDEGAWNTSLNNSQVLEILSKEKIRIGVDAAASSFYKNGIYTYKNKSLNRTAQIHYINSLIKRFNIFYLEDPLEENDFPGFAKISKKNLICGDDLTVTHIGRLKKAISKKSINCMIVKPNQNGSLLDVAKVVALCKKHNIKTVLSHRSGETLDNALADYAFGFQTDFIKCGISTPWREVKLKRLIEIEENLR